MFFLFGYDFSSGSDPDSLFPKDRIHKRSSKDTEFSVVLDPYFSRGSDLVCQILDPDPVCQILDP